MENFLKIDHIKNFKPGTIKPAWFRVRSHVDQYPYGRIFHKWEEDWKIGNSKFLLVRVTVIKVSISTHGLLVVHVQLYSII